MPPSTTPKKKTTPAPPPPWYEAGLKFSCTQCGDCCTGPSGYVWFNDTEAQAIARHLGLDTATFRRRFAHRAGNRWTLNERKTEHGFDCVFLERDDQGRAMCRIYPVRPEQCQTWPFWPENTDKPSDWRRTARTCPGVDHGQFYPADQIRIILDRHTD